MRVAINGLGRIGRAAFKVILERPGLELVAVNDLAALDNLAYLLKYDTVYGRYEKTLSASNGHIKAGNAEVQVLNLKDPARLPWRDLKIDCVFECTGAFTRKVDLEKHLRAGAKHVVLSSPSKDSEIETIVYGVNQPRQNGHIVSCASCTTNAITPVVEIVGRRIGIKKAVMTTIHAYTTTQTLVDSPAKKDYRRGRAGAANLVPSTTGAALATTKALPEFAGKFNGVAVRVPVAVGSIADIVFVTKRSTAVEEVNGILRQEAGTERYREVVRVSDDPLVSSDIIKDPSASIVDLGMTQVVDGDLVKVMSWYDNEWGYTSQMIREAVRAFKDSPVTAGR